MFVIVFKNVGWRLRNPGGQYFAAAAQSSCEQASKNVFATSAGAVPVSLTNLALSLPVNSVVEEKIESFAR